MPEQRVCVPDFYEHGERMTQAQFRGLYGDVERIFTLTNAPDLMSLGPSIVSAESAIDDGWLDSLKDFRPMLRAASVPGLSLDISGTEYTGLRLFFKQGGNEAADKKWLGDIHFSNENDDIDYKLHTDGRIKITKRSADSPWTQLCWAFGAEAQELSGALLKVKEHLHKRKVGELALSQ